MIPKTKIKPVSYWRKWWKLYSTWLNVAGLAVMGWLLEAPQHAIEAWLFLPDDVRSLIPPDYAKYIPAALWILAFLARFIKQEKLSKEESEK